MSCWTWLIRVNRYVSTSVGISSISGSPRLFVFRVVMCSLFSTPSHPVFDRSLDFTTCIISRVKDTSLDAQSQITNHCFRTERWLSAGWQCSGHRQATRPSDKKRWAYYKGGASAGGLTQGSKSFQLSFIFDIHGHSEGGCNRRWCCSWCSVSRPLDSSLYTTTYSQTQSPSATPPRGSRTCLHSARIGVAHCSTDQFKRKREPAEEESPDFFATWWLWHGERLE